ncbi:MAG: MIP family channel protein [Parcubacteria group bacterium]|nr:MIP family channel protein [Parcubacteria group bacterium]
MFNMTNFKKYLAELVGTFTLVLIGAGTVIANFASRGKVGLLGIALAFGFVVMVMVYVFGRISGAHLNPAVTIALFLKKKINFQDSVLYVIFQNLGAVLAGLVLLFSFGSSDLVAQGVTVLGENISLFQGVAIESFLTFFLMMAILSFVDQESEIIIGAAVIGVTISMDILFGGVLTGASMNPARTFGPALVAGVWNNHWIYWVGPILGAAVAVCISKIWKK